MKSDQEPAIIALAREAKTASGIDIVIPECSLVGESQSNGTIERAVQSIEGQIRVMKDALEFNYETELDTRHPALTWLIHHAGFLISRFEIGADGRTAYHRWKGKPYRKELVELGETIHYKPAKEGGKASKLAARWEDGIWLGVREVSNEIYVGAKNGVEVVRDVRRRPLSERYDLDLLKAVTGEAQTGVEHRRSTSQSDYRSAS